VVVVQRRDPLLAALAEAGDVRASAQVHIANGQMEQFAGTDAFDKPVRPTSILRYGPPVWAVDVRQCRLGDWELA